MEVPSNEKTIPKIAETDDNFGSVENNEFQTQMSSLFNDMNWLVAVSTVPTKRPLQPMAMIQLYINGTTKRLYIYDVVGNAWHYIALT